MDPKAFDQIITAITVGDRHSDQRSGCSGKSKSQNSGKCIKKVAQKEVSVMLRDNSQLATKLTSELNGEQKIVTVFNKVDGYQRASHLSLGVDEYEICQFVPSTATDIPQDGATNTEATINAPDSEAADGEGAVVTVSDTWYCLMCSKQDGDHESIGECARRQWYKRNRVDLPKRGRAPNTVFGCTHSYEMVEHCKYGLHYYAVASKVHDLVGRDWTLAQHKGDANHMQYSHYAASYFGVSHLCCLVPCCLALWCLIPLLHSAQIAIQIEATTQRQPNGRC